MTELNIKIKKEKESLELKTKKGTRISDLIQSAGFFLEHPCAGRGICGKCKIKAKGKLSPATKAELKLLGRKNLKKGLRLSCQTKILGEAEIWLPSQAVVTDKIFAGGYPVKKLKGPLGIAIDLGTTTVAVFLSTLNDGLIHKGSAVLNQQISLGAEIISRLNSAFENKSRELKFQAEESIKKAFLRLGLSREQKSQIQRAVLVGNSAMHHLFLGLPVENLIKLPFQPIVLEARKIKSHFLGREIEFWLPPLIGGFVGSDALACLLYFGLGIRKKPLAVIDLGTNGEVMLTDGENILVASTAAGPAFEGVNIECGMRAEPGAITAVQRNPKGELELEIIGLKQKQLARDQLSPQKSAHLKAKGLAGSGLLSLVNLLRKEGKIDASGRLTTEKFFLTDKIYLSQADVREVQKAKSAVRSAFEVLLENLELKKDELEELILTGSFGARINIKDALELGLIPELPEERVKVFANGAGMGAGMMLNQEAFDFACQLAKKTKHLELFAHQGFMDKFIKNMRL